MDYDINPAWERGFSRSTKHWRLPAGKHEAFVWVTPEGFRARTVEAGKMGAIWRQDGFATMEDAQRAAQGKLEELAP